MKDEKIAFYPKFNNFHGSLLVSCRKSKRRNLFEKTRFMRPVKKTRKKLLALRKIRFRSNESLDNTNSFLSINSTITLYLCEVIGFAITDARFVK